MLNPKADPAKEVLWLLVIVTGRTLDVPTARLPNASVAGETDTGRIPVPVSATAG
jgi:hypothetical protein